MDLWDKFKPLETGQLCFQSIPVNENVGDTEQCLVIRKQCIFYVVLIVCVRTVRCACELVDAVVKIRTLFEFYLDVSINYG